MVGGSSPSGPTNIASNKSRLFAQPAFFFTVFLVSTAVCFRVFPGGVLKWLKSQGVEATDAKKHIQLRYQGKVSHMPRHPGDEITTGLAEAIKKQLGLK